MVTFNKEKFEFPSGYSIEETDSGSLVITDTNGDVAFERTDGSDWDTDKVVANTMSANYGDMDILYTKSRDADVIVDRVPEGEPAEFQYFVVGADGEIFRGYNAADALEAAFDHPDAGYVYIKPATYQIDKQIVVPEHVTLDMHEDTLLQNTLSDTYTHPLVFQGDTTVKRLFLDCNDAQGVLFGETQSDSDIRIGDIDVYGGGNSEDPANGNYHANIRIQGYLHYANSIHTLGGHIGLDLIGADIFIDNVIGINSDIGMYLRNAVSHLYMGNIDIESYADVGIKIDYAAAVMMSNVDLWVNDVAYSVTPPKAIEIGQQNTVSNLNINADIVRAADTAIELYGGLRNSTLDLKLSNYEEFDFGFEMTTGVDFVEQVGPSVDINTSIPSSVTNPISGSTAGATINGIAQEAAGSGNKPTASDYSVHQVVSNTDDDTLYWKDTSGSMRQIV